MSDKSVYTELNRIQRELKAPKNQFNKFGGFHYRSCEDILEGLKEVLGECSLLINDEIIQVGERIYVKATAKLIYDDNANRSIEVSAMAREPENKKGMDEAQITGSASSYARKYALSGLFAIDDNKDADVIESVTDKLDGVDSVEDLTKLFKSLSDTQQKKMTKAFTKKKSEILANGTAAK